MNFKSSILRNRRLCGFHLRLSAPSKALPLCLASVDYFSKNASTGTTAVPPLCETSGDKSSRAAETAVVSMLMMKSHAVKLWLFPLINELPDRIGGFGKATLPDRSSFFDDLGGVSVSLIP